MESDHTKFVKSTMEEVNEIVSDINNLPDFFRNMATNTTRFNFKDTQRELLLAADVIQMLLKELENLVLHISPEIAKHYRDQFN